MRGSGNVLSVMRTKVTDMLVKNCDTKSEFDKMRHNQE